MKFLDKFNIHLHDYNNLKIALTHTSYANEQRCESYERLEFLGDAVLELVVSEYLYSNYSYGEGDMTKMRARYVCEPALCEYAKVIGYIPYIKVGHGQLNNINDTIVADVFEAILGVIYLECGFDVAKKYVLDIIAPFIQNGTVFYSDYKSILQEMVQTDKKSLEYILVDEYGPAHDKTYIVEVKIDKIVYGKGIAHSKKEAEQRAAKDAYQKAVSNEV